MKYAAQSFRDGECRNVLHFFIQQMDMMGAESQTMGTMHKRKKRKKPKSLVIKEVQCR